MSRVVSEFPGEPHTIGDLMGMTAPAQPVQGVEAVAVKPLEWSRPDRSGKITAIAGPAIATVYPLEDQDHRYAWSLGGTANGVEYCKSDAIKMLTVTYEARIRSALYASPAPAPEAPADRYRDALKRIAEHPEKSDNPLGSYAVGFAFWNVQKI